LQNNIAQPRGDNSNGATSYATKEGSGREEEKNLNKTIFIGEMKKVNSVPLVVLLVRASILVITFMAVSLGGSDSVIDQGLEGSSPFFGLASRTWSVMEAYLHYWDVAHGKVVKTDKVVCSAPVLPPITSATNMTKAFSLVQITAVWLD